MHFQALNGELRGTSEAKSAREGAFLPEAPPAAALQVEIVEALLDVVSETLGLLRFYYSFTWFYMVLPWFYHNGTSRWTNIGLLGMRIAFVKVNFIWKTKASTRNHEKNIEKKNMVSRPPWQSTAAASSPCKATRTRQGRCSPGTPRGGLMASTGLSKTYCRFWLTSMCHWRFSAVYSCLSWFYYRVEICLADTIGRYLMVMMFVAVSGSFHRVHTRNPLARLEPHLSCTLVAGAKRLRLCRQPVLSPFSYEHPLNAA